MLKFVSWDVCSAAAIAVVLMYPAAVCVVGGMIRFLAYQERIDVAIHLFARRGLSTTFLLRFVHCHGSLFVPIGLLTRR